MKHEGVYGGEPEVSFTAATSAYNGLHWRIATTTGDVLPQERRLLVYSAAWQPIEEHVHVDADIGLDQPAYNHVLQEFYGTRYIDDAVLRRVRMPDAYGEGTEPDQWAWETTVDTDFYHITDVQYTTRAMVRAYGKGEVVERVRFSAYGEATHWNPADINHDGTIDYDDYTALAGKIGYTMEQSSYDADADLNRDGEVSLTDEDYRVAWEGRMAPSPGRITDSTALEADPGGVGPDNTFGYCGYAFVKESLLYAVRFRWYDPRLGRWLERDPAGYVDGMNVYEYGRGAPHMGVDSLGLEYAILRGPYGPQWNEQRQTCEVYFTKDYAPSWYDYYTNPFYSPTASTEVHVPINGLSKEECSKAGLAKLAECDTATLAGIEAQIAIATGIHYALTTGENSAWVTAGGVAEQAVFIALGGVVRFAKMVRSLDELAAEANSSLRGGQVTKAGSALQSHAKRPGAWSRYKDLTTNAERAAAMREAIEEILTSPGSVTRTRPNGEVEIYAPDGRGIKFNSDGSFKGLLTRSVRGDACQCGSVSK